MRSYIFSIGRKVIMPPILRTGLSLALLVLLMAAPAPAGQNVFGIHLGSGLLWAPHDRDDLDGERLYREHYPFLVELSYGDAIQGTFGFNHIFSQEEEHVELDSLDEELYFTPKLRQYIVHLGVLLDRSLAPRLHTYAGLSGGLVWRAYNPGWKDESFWDKVRPCAIAQVGLDLKLGPKAWIGVSWRNYAVSWRSEGRWTQGEFNRMRRMNVLSATVSYYP